MAKHLTDIKDFKAALEGDKVVFVDWFATWCGPCKMISPKYNQLAEQHPDAVFFKIDIDEFPDLSQDADIQSMPTFHAFKGGKLIAEFKGAIPAKLEDFIKANAAA